MNHWKYSELTVGHEEKFKVTITDAMMEQFFQITGDDNPLHRDASFAEKKGYSSCVVYGMLSASFLSTLAGVYLPGENSLIHEVDTKFVKPVFVGDSLEVKGIITECNDLFHQIVTYYVILHRR